MPRNKDLKRLVRTRMTKTGESYTTARAQLLKKKPTKPTPKAKVDFAALAGMSDDKVKAATGCNWEKWVKALDHYGAQDMKHRDIAVLIKQKYDTPDWWTQTVAVGYERIKGLRARGQQRDGSYRAQKTKTVNVSVEDLYEAWADGRKRARWLQDARVKSSSKLKSMRLELKDGQTAVVGFFAKGAGKSYVTVEEKVASKDQVERTKEAWTDRLTMLQEILA